MPEEIYYVIVNLSVTRDEASPAEGAAAEERVQRLVQGRLQAPGVQPSRINVYRAVETT